MSSIVLFFSFTRTRGGLAPPGRRREGSSAPCRHHGPFSVTLLLWSRHLEVLKRCKSDKKGEVFDENSSLLRVLVCKTIHALEDSEEPGEEPVLQDQLSPGLKDRAGASRVSSRWSRRVSRAPGGSSAVVTVNRRLDPSVKRRSPSELLRPNGWVFCRALGGALKPRAAAAAPFDQ